MLALAALATVLALGLAVAVLLRRLSLIGLRRPSNKTAPWPDLLPELLGLVLSRVPSHADRVRLRAPCRQWRRSGDQPLPPLPPWLALRDDTFLSVPDGAVHRLPLASDGDVSYRLSTGSMLFLVRRDGSCCVMNPCSGETTPQRISPDDLDLNLDFYGSDRIRKVLLTDHSVTVLTRGKMNNKNVNIFTRGPPQEGSSSCSTMEWALPGAGSYIADIALFREKVYVLTADYDESHYLPELHVLDVGDEQTGIRSVQRIHGTPRDPCLTATDSCRRLVFFYMVASGDRLLVVERRVDLDPVDFVPTRVHVEVFEAMGISDGGCARWRKVDTLMGHALFVSRGCSESIPACGGGDGGNGGPREDCIYFMTERITALFHRKRKPEDDLLDCVVYNIRDRTLESLPLEELVTESMVGPWHPTWIFPPVV